MQKKFINQGNLTRITTHPVDFMHRPFDSMLFFLTEPFPQGHIPDGLQYIWNKARDAAAATAMPPIPRGPTSLPTLVTPQQSRSSAAIRTSSRVRVNVKGKAERVPGEFRKMTPSNRRTLEESQRASWQKTAGGNTNIHGEEKKRDEEF